MRNVSDKILLGMGNVSDKISDTILLGMKNVSDKILLGMRNVLDKIKSHI